MRFVTIIVFIEGYYALKVIENNIENNSSNIQLNDFCRKGSLSGSVFF